MKILLLTLLAGVALSAAFFVSADTPATPEDVAAAPADAEKTASGLVSRVLVEGSGSAHPNAWDEVEVHYSGWTTDGKLFDSSVQRGNSIKFGLDRVIPGWTEGVQLMVVGEKRRFWIPADLAYGETPARPGAPAGDLTFDVELIGIIAKPAPPSAPANIDAAPADAIKTESGLASKVLQAGSGDLHPGATDIVTVHYSGWTADGKLFDSSVNRGTPATFGLDKVIPGWTEGVQLMVVGEKRRFWIPAAMAYGDTPSRPGAPVGNLVFDVELIELLTLSAPADVAEAPADAERTPSGLASKMLSPGDGGDKPKRSSQVTVHYSGWMTNGELFDSSLQRQRPASFALTGVIKGWTEGLQLMTKGEKRRFWIPAELAYGRTPSRPGAPAGDLVFDVELIEFH